MVNTSSSFCFINVKVFKVTISRRRKRIKIFKAIIIVLFIIVFTFVQLVPNMSLVKIECLLDYTHDYTKSVNDWFKDNKGAKNALMIIGGLMSDIVTLATLGMWTWKGKTWRLPIALVFIYVSKAVTSVSIASSCLHFV